MSYFKEVKIKGLADRFGFEGQYTPMRDQKMATPIRLIGTTFGSAIDTVFWTAINSGAASASGVATTIATMTSGTANDGYGQISSVRKARFLFAHPLQFRAAIRIPVTVKADTTRRWGAFTTTLVTPLDGFYFRLDGAGLLSVCRVANSSVTAVDSGSFNGDVSAYVVDTNVHAYEIIFFTMGAWFYIDNVLVHTFLPTTALLTQDNIVPVTVSSVNSASGTTSATIECWNASIIRLGQLLTQPSSYYHAVGTTAGVNLKLEAGNLHSMIINNVVNNATITLSDSTSTTTPAIWVHTAGATSTGVVSIDFKGLPFFEGLRLTVATQNASVTVIYE